MFNNTEPILISAAKITLFIGITRSYGCFYVFLEKFGQARVDVRIGKLIYWVR